jgi:hypothetical protein
MSSSGKLRARRKGEQVVHAEQVLGFQWSLASHLPRAACNLRVFHMTLAQIRQSHLLATRYRMLLQNPA